MTYEEIRRATISALGNNEDKVIVTLGDLSRLLNIIEEQKELLSAKDKRISYLEHIKTSKELDEYA